MARGAWKKRKGRFDAANITGDEQILRVCREPLKEQPRTIPIQPKGDDPQSAGFVGELASRIVKAKERHSPIGQLRHALSHITAHRTDAARGERRDDGGDTERLPNGAPIKHQEAK